MDSLPHLYFVTDPLVTTAGSVRPGLLLSKKFFELGYEVSLITTKASEAVGNLVEEMGVGLITVGPERSFIGSMPNLDAWLRHILVNNRCESPLSPSLVINTSSNMILQADAYYAQGIMMNAVKDMMSELGLLYNFFYRISKDILNYLEKRTILEYDLESKYFVANSHFCAEMYESCGVSVDAVICPPIDLALFKPSCSTPTEDYVLTYYGKLGKESNFGIIRDIADRGIKIKVFGEKPPDSIFIDHDCIDYQGKISDQELVELYSNALLTLFAFKHEPFGYIPVESMGCGTPVLTYNRQGPSETVVNNVTGWLVDNDCGMIDLVSRIWETGVGNNMRRNCVNSVQKYSVENISEQWMGVLYDLSEKR